MRMRHLLFGFAFAAGIGAAPARADIVIVISAKAPAAALTQEQAADIFLGRANSLPGGGSVTPVDQPEASPTREEFYRKLTGKSPAQLKAYWSKIVFTGKGQPPREYPDHAAVKKMLTENPGLIGYIDKSALDSSVRALLTVH